MRPRPPESYQLLDKSNPVILKWGQSHIHGSSMKSNVMVQDVMQALGKIMTENEGKVADSISSVIRQLYFPSKTIPKT